MMRPRHLYPVGGDDLDAQIAATLQEAENETVAILTNNLRLHLHTVVMPEQAEAMARAQERRAGELGDIFGRLANLLEQRGGTNGN